MSASQCLLLLAAQQHTGVLSTPGMGRRPVPTIVIAGLRPAYSGNTSICLLCLFPKHACSCLLMIQPNAILACLAQGLAMGCQPMIATASRVATHPRVVMESKARQGGKRRRNEEQEAQDGTDSQPATAGDLFYPVDCEICDTELGVRDSNEVFHFTNVVPST